VTGARPASASSAAGSGNGFVLADLSQQHPVRTGPTPRKLAKINPSGCSATVAAMALSYSPSWRLSSCAAGERLRREALPRHRAGGARQQVGAHPLGQHMGRHPAHVVMPGRSRPSTSCPNPGGDGRCRIVQHERQGDLPIHRGKQPGRRSAAGPQSPPAPTAARGGRASPAFGSLGEVLAPHMPAPGARVAANRHEERGGSPPERLMRQPPRNGVARRSSAAAATAPLVGLDGSARQDRAVLGRRASGGDRLDRDRTR
jgi:hypothetical protein